MGESAIQAQSHAKVERKAGQLEGENHCILFGPRHQFRNIGGNIAASGYINLTNLP